MTGFGLSLSMSSFRHTNLLRFRLMLSNWSITFGLLPTITNATSSRVMILCSNCFKPSSMAMMGLLVCSSPRIASTVKYCCSLSSSPSSSSSSPPPLPSRAEVEVGEEKERRKRERDEGGVLVELEGRGVERLDKGEVELGRTEGEVELEREGDASFFFSSSLSTSIPAATIPALTSLFLICLTSSFLTGYDTNEARVRSSFSSSLPFSSASSTV
mmetsp:Transcript_34187/g.88265  ORF Transcript_34187/g.88265 Transcript_34187/m.88265 type:complete len:215 (+) Transcript_34187:673-1317(+)